MGESDLKIDLFTSSALGIDQRAELSEMCGEAYGEDIAPYIRDIGAGWHLWGTLNGSLVSHAMWVTRHLQAGSGPELNTAYVELVATSPQYQGHGFASRILEQIRIAVQDYEIAALSPADTTLYERCGWERWRGELYVRTANGRESTPDESVMILKLPHTPGGLCLLDDLSVEWRQGEVW